MTLTSARCASSNASQLGCSLLHRIRRVTQQIIDLVAVANDGSAVVFKNHVSSGRPPPSRARRSRIFTPSSIVAPFWINADSLGAIRS
ncbi:MAG: hypothetical protein ABI431_00370 [Candidatus Tumulicola sp.]